MYADLVELESDSDSSAEGRLNKNVNRGKAKVGKLAFLGMELQFTLY
jgi:hypothetical protein